MTGESLTRGFTQSYDNRLSSVLSSLPGSSTALPCCKDGKLGGSENEAISVWVSLLSRRFMSPVT